MIVASVNMKNFLVTQLGREYVLTSLYSSESNGKAEKLNRSINEGIYAILTPISNELL